MFRLNETTEVVLADEKTAMLEEFAHFHPALLEIIEFVLFLPGHVEIDTNIRFADNVKYWPLAVYDPPPTWIRGKLIVIGDAAHPIGSQISGSTANQFSRSIESRNSLRATLTASQTLTFGDQGWNQTIDDGGALGYLLNEVHDSAMLASRLKVFETMCRNRTSRVQTLSRVKVGKEKSIKHEIRKFADDADSARLLARVHFLLLTLCS